MIRVFLFTLVVVAAVANPVSNVFEIDISPEEAQKYLANLPFNEPQLSGKTATLPLVRWNDPRFRSADAGPTNGHYWKNGREIENTEDYVEDVYEASQFHGQDGLGQYAYGYSAPESAKVENREHSGDVRGSYTFKSGDDQVIKVNYWADSQGFHQEDNIPKVELQPAQETDDVREARLAHEKAWQEAASAAQANPDPQGEYDPSKYEYESSASEQQNFIAEGPREAKAYPQQNKYQSQPLSGSGYAGQQGGFATKPQGYGGQQQGYGSQQQGFGGQQQGFGGQQQGIGGQQQGFAGQQPGFGVQQQGFGGAQGGYGGQQQSSSQQYQTSSPTPQSFQQSSSASASYQSASYHPQQGFQAQAQASGPNTQYQAHASQGHQAYQGQAGSQQDDAEPTGPPRGFFYSFNYPVSIIEPKNAQGHQGQQPAGHPVDHDTVGVSAYHG